MKLLNYSGGIDSTYVLYKELKEDPNTPILVHHCKMARHPDRRALEENAATLTLKWIYDNLSSNFRVVTSTVIRPIFSRMSDIETVYFQSAGFIRYFSDIDTILVCASKTDLEQGEDYNKRAENRNKLFEMGVNDTSRVLNWKYPISKLTRKEIIEDIPKDLLELCWYCRMAGPNPCGTCPTCINTVQYLKKD